MKTKSGNAHQRSQPADLVLLNGKTVTVDDAYPQVEAVAIHGDTIVGVGTNERIQPLIGRKTLVLELDGKLVIPGFIEGHGHLISLGQSLERLNLRKARNWHEIVELVQQATANSEPGKWILGEGWHQEKWDELQTELVSGFPTHLRLSEASPENPTLLTHASGHLCITNAYGMRLAGISEFTSDPTGGKIVRDPAGVATGVFIETAMQLISEAADKSKRERTCWQTEGDLRRFIRLAAKHCLSKGVTGFHDAGLSFDTIDLLRRLAKARELDIRLWAMVNESNERLREEILNYRIDKARDNHLTVRAIKRLIDGALGAYSAWLLEPYSDLQTSTGFSTLLNAYSDYDSSSQDGSLEPRRYIAETAQIAIENGFQLCTHAIGDRAARETLDIYEQAFREHANAKDLRWRVEHASVLAPRDIPRFGQMGVIASVQAIGCISDGLWMIDRLGETRARERAFVFQQLIKSGATLVNGTDAPVEDVNPLPCFYASVTCKLPNGTVFWPDEQMTREQALRSYTLNCAYAAHEESIKGSITPGKVADLVILSKDIMTVPEKEILSAKVLYTIVGGDILYQDQ